MKNLFLLIAVLFLVNCISVPIDMNELMKIDKDSYYIFFTIDKGVLIRGPIINFLFDQASDETKKLAIAFDLRKGNYVNICSVEGGNRLSLHSISAWYETVSRFTTHGFESNPKGIYVPDSLRNMSIDLEKGKITFIGNFVFSKDIEKLNSYDRDLYQVLGGYGLAGYIDFYEFHKFEYAKRVLLEKCPFIDKSIILNPYENKLFAY